MPRLRRLIFSDERAKNGGRCEWQPGADVVQKFVHVVVKPLLSLFGAPDFDSLLDKPLHHEWRFIIPAAQPVKHEDKQDVELIST